MHYGFIGTVFGRIQYHEMRGLGGVGAEKLFLQVPDGYYSRCSSGPIIPIR